MKSDDLEATLGCYSCHLQLDGPESYLPDAYDVVFTNAKRRTLRYWLRHGKITQEEHDANQ